VADPGANALTQAAQAHRLVSALIVAAARAGVEPASVPALRQRLLLQQATFAEVAAGHGGVVPPLAPGPAEVTSARTALGDLSPAVVADAFTMAASTLDLADRLLADPASVHFAPVTTPPARPDGEPAAYTAVPARGRMRNALIYGAYALVVLAMQLIIFFGVADEGSAVPWAPVCALVFPLIAWAAGLLTIGRGPRSPKLGALICFLPNLLFCCGVGGTAILRSLGQLD
jgi:hypothetical protein